MEKIINRKALGVNVKKYRQQKKMSVEKMAEQAGVSVSHIRNIESASANPSAEVLVHIANALEIPIDILLSDSLTGETERQARIMEFAIQLQKCTVGELKLVNKVVETVLTELENMR